MPFVKSHIESYRSIASILNTQSLKNCLINGNFKSAKAKIIKHCNLPNTPITYKSAIRKIYNDLFKYHRNEYIFKNELINSQIISKFSLENTKIISEFKIAESIADLVFFNGSIKVFEIKTDFDNLNKLDKQLNDYRKFANEIFIVTSVKYADSLISLYKKSQYGIMIFTDDGKFDIIKKPIKGNKYLDHEVIFKTLRKQEYLNIIFSYFGFIPNVPNTLLFKQCFNLVQQIEISEFQKLVLHEIKKRTLETSIQFQNKKTEYGLNQTLISLNIDNVSLIKLNQILKTNII